MAEWKEYELNQICSRLSSGKGLPAKKISDNGKYPVYGGNGLRGYTETANFEGDCAIIGRQGAYCGNVRYFSGTAYMTEHAVVTCANEDNNTRYLSYLLSTMNLGRLSGQSAQPGLSVKTLGKQIVKVPPLATQNKVVSILAALDTKIEDNEKINKNLEQQAQAIFKSWFVDFEPFNGEMPFDWTVSKLGDIASIKTNSFSPVKNPDAQLEHYSIPAYDEQKYPVFESAAGVKSNKYILSKNSVMISKLNPDTKRVWRPMCLSALAVSSTEFIIFEAFNPAYRDFVFSIIDSAAFSDWMCAHTTGSTNSRQRTTPSATLEFQVALPDEKTITDFCAIVTPMYDAIAANICENQRLAQLRDSILPKLMSGELDVSDINL